MQKAIRLLVLCCLTGASLQGGFVPIGLSSVSNATFATMLCGLSNGCAATSGILNSGLFPTGTQTYNGVPFNIGALWSANNAAAGGSGTQSVVIPINQTDVSTVNTLINTEWGQGSGNLLTLIFTFSDSSTYTVNLVGNQGVRDYNSDGYTSTIASSWAAPGGLTDSTVNVWNDNGMLCNAESSVVPAPQITCSMAAGTYQRLDQQTINLPASTINLILVSMTLVDSGNADFQRGWIGGLTLTEPVPEPGTCVLMFGGLAAVVLRKRLRR